MTRKQNRRLKPGTFYRPCDGCGVKVDQAYAHMRKRYCDPCRQLAWQRANPKKPKLCQRCREREVYTPYGRYCYQCKTPRSRGENRYVDSDGYMQVKAPDGRWLAEHRYVMEQKLGRRLRKGESVHHKNGRRGDNSPENLELWVGPIRSGVRASDLTCPHCGKLWDTAS